MILMDKPLKFKMVDFKQQSASLLAIAGLYDQLASILEDFQVSIDSLVSSQTALRSQLEALQGNYQSLSTKYSELLYKFSEVKQSSK